MTVDFHFYIISFVTIIISSVGIFGNINVIWAVRKCKELRVKHGTLLASLCFYQSICLVFELFGSIRMITNCQSSEKLCYYSILPLIVASNIQLSLVLIIALDLVLLVLRPIIYQRIQTVPYCYLMQIPCYIYAFITGVLSVFYLRDIPILVCNVPLAYPPPIHRYWNLSVICICIMIIGVYAFITSIMWYKDYENLKKIEGSCVMDPSMRYQRKLIKSLSALMTVFFCSAFVSALLIRVPHTMPKETADLIKTYATLPGLVSLGQNYYVYYIMSKDYRKAFKKNLEVLKKLVTFKIKLKTPSMFQITISSRKSSLRVQKS